MTKIQKRKLNIFLSSFLMALGFWIFFSLSKPYTYQSKITIQFNNSYAKASNRIDTFNAKILGSGWDYLFHELKPNHTLKLKISTVQTEIQLNKQLNSLNKQLGKNLRILSIWPNKILFSINNSSTKVVPVVLRYALSFEDFYGLSAPITLQPSTVTLSGSAEELRKIKAIYSEVLEKKNVNTPVKQWITLVNPKTEISIYPKQVLATIPVNSFTEKEITLPIHIKNNTQKMQVALLPAKVHIHVLVALSNYEKIGPSEFEAFIDLANWDAQKRGALPIKFSKIPAFTQLIRTEPQTVDLLIYN